MLWALVEFLKRQGQQIQIFHDQARFLPVEGGKAICGESSRYLDSWLMSPELCRESYAHGASGCDLALVHGRYSSARLPQESTGGSLEDLCNWLDLPQLVVIDVSQLADCRLPIRPQGAVGLLLDRVSEDNFHRWQTLLEAQWGVPVLGALPELADVRHWMSQPKYGGRTTCELCWELGRQLGRHARLESLFKIASSHGFADVPNKMFRCGDHLRGLTVAVAYDEAVDCYFPDVLDLLEVQGAKVVDFSPLRDEALPAGTDVVYLGCGHPERFAAELAGNHCIMLALRNHVCRGRRIYAEGGGLAYLCQHLLMPSGEQLPMAGVVPGIAVFRPDAKPQRPTEVTLSRDHWLGEAGTKLRGYLNTSWRIEPAGGLEGYVAEPGREMHLVARHQALGSRLHINFAAQPDFVRRFSSASDDTLDASRVR